MTVTKNIIKAYLKAGTTYPQIRGTICIALCAEISKYSKAEILEFLQSNLSPIQMEIITKSMNKLHEMAGIVISGDTEQLVLTEWAKSKGAVMATLLRFFRKEMELGLRGSQIINYPTEENFIKISNLRSEDMELFRLISQKASNLMYASIDLSYIFRLTFYEQNQRKKKFEKKQEYYNRVLMLYGINSPLDNPKDSRRECLKWLNQHIRNTLISEYPHLEVEIDAILWGII